MRDQMRGRARGTSITYVTLNIPNNRIPRIWSLDVYGRYNVIGGGSLYIQRCMGFVVPLSNLARLVIRFARAGSTANVRVASSTVRARSSERVACVGRERSRRVASRRRVASSSRVGRRTGRRIRRRRAASDSAAPPGNAVVRARAGVGGETRSGRRTVCTVVK